MRAYIAIKFHEDSRNKGQIEKLSNLLHQYGFESICIARDFEKWGQVKFNSHELMQLVFKQIDQSNFIIVDLTEKGVGIGIEAGYAYAKNIPIVTIASKSSDISESLRGISSCIFFYDNYDDLLPFFAELSTIL